MKIAIIGGGAAGLMAAATIVENASSTEGSVVLFEKNSGVGRKILLTGGGRCNLTTGLNDIKEVLNKYPRGSRFLRYAMHNFPPNEVYKWFENHGVKLKIEKDLRVFPVSNDGREVVHTFEEILKNGRVKIVKNSSVREILIHDNGFLVDGEEFDRVILTTGGNAYRQTGSSGDGYEFASKLGHTITSLSPSLHSFNVAEKWVSKLKGISFPRASFRIVASKEYEFDGPFLFTGKGLSGPAIFALSSLSAFEKFGTENQMKIFIDFFPDKSHMQIKDEFIKAFHEHPRKSFLNTLNFFTPHSFAIEILKELKIDGTKINAEFDHKNLNRVIEFLKNFPLNIIGKNPGEEFVTAGGVSLNEVDDKTMQSKLVPGLYFAGEILDIDGFTGGFNLQVAWATGRAASEAVLS